MYLRVKLIVFSISVEDVDILYLAWSGQKLIEQRKYGENVLKELFLTPSYSRCYPTVALWLQKPSKNKIICKNNRKIVLEIVTVEEEKYEKS